MTRPAAPTTRLVLLTVAVLVLIPEVDAARAGGPHGEIGVGTDGEVSTGVDAGSGAGSTPGGGQGPPAGATTPRVPWILYPTARRYGTEEDVNRGWCRDDTWARLPEGADAEEATAARVREYEQLFGPGGVLHGLNSDHRCEGSDPVAAISAPMAEDVVASFVRADWLPRPELSVPPGFGLVGMPAFLVTDHELAHELPRQDVDLGILRIPISWQATGVSRVDWGDGQLSEHHVGGRAWPDGEVTHTYQDAGSYAISLQDTWTISYQLGPITGSTTAVLDPVVLDALEVEERRSVRVISRFD